MSRAPNLPTAPKELSRRRESPTESRQFEISLLTPMVGGAASAWVLNKTRPFREPSIRGHLRFWWRAFHDQQDPEALLEQESRIWGNTKQASAVSVEASGLKDTKWEKLAPVAREEQSYKGLPPYALFPLIDLTCDILRRGTFTLTLRYPKEFAEDIETTLRLWILFGGLGARTRRGCGSLRCDGLTRDIASPEALEGWVRKIAPKGPSRGTSNHPVLHNSALALKALGAKEPDAIVPEWKRLIDAYGDFRQREGIGRANRSRETNRPGRSYWPEPDVIRRRVKMPRDAKHQPRHPAESWCPRAAYGMPLGIEFRNEPSDPKGRFEIRPKDKETDRWPSPVILKLASLGEGVVHALCCILNAAIPEAILTHDHKPLHGSRLDRIDEFKGKTMIHRSDSDKVCDKHPHDALIDHLKKGGLL